MVGSARPQLDVDTLVSLAHGATMSTTTGNSSALEQKKVPHDPGRLVGEESRKTYAEKIATGFLDKYLSGPTILEVGFRGYRDEPVVPIVPQAIGIDLGYPGYDGRTLPFDDGTVDAVYSSHCLEHIPDYKQALSDWHRVLKVGGYLIVAVPHQYLFEKQRDLPSRSNIDHRRYYTSESLLAELREAWPENGYRVRQLVENDTGFDYSCGPGVASPGCYEIELVAEKIAVPSWRLDDGSVRPYSAAEFHANGSQPDKWAIEVDFSGDHSCKVWGPYARLVPARYVATFCFETDFHGDSLTSDIILDVAVNRNRAASVALSGSGGATTLRSGRVAVPFDVVGEPAHVEFRIFAESTPLEGRLTFKGVEVRFG